MSLRTSHLQWAQEQKEEDTIVCASHDEGPCAGITGNQDK